MFLKSVKRFRKTIGFRLALWYSTIFIFSALVLFGMAYFFVSSSVRGQELQMILSKINEYALMEKNSGFESLMDEIRLENAGNKSLGFFVRVADSKNQTLFLTSPHSLRKVDFNLIKKNPFSGIDQWLFLKKRGRGKDAMQVYSKVLSNDYILQVGRGYYQLDKILDRFRMIFTGIMIPVILLGFTGGPFLAFRALRPVNDLIKTVSSVKTGNMDVRVPQRGTGDELDELATLFNGMLEKIEILINGMHEALDNVAHDLRTPMTRLRNVVETRLQEESDPETLREALMDCAEESERIMTMLNTLMDISEAQTGVMKLNTEKVDIVSLIDEVIELYQYVAEEKEINFTTVFPKDLFSFVDPYRIRQVIANLLDNAVKYSIRGGHVEIEAIRQADGVVISIKDSGIGISDIDLPKIFYRLYRGDKSRSERGLGLGLSLVKAVVQAHNGRIEVDSSPGQGAEFKVFLPDDLNC
jgi:signal transduction histidine kinase